MDTCPQCGYMHPPVAKGQCPMAKAKQIKEEAAADVDTKITNLSLDIQKAYLDRVRKLETTEQKEQIAIRILGYIKAL